MSATEHPAGFEIDNECKRCGEGCAGPVPVCAGCLAAVNVERDQL